MTRPRAFPPFAAAAPLAAAVFAGACSPSSSTPAATLTRTDSAGVEIVISTDSAWTAATRWKVGPTPALALGDDPNAPDPYQFLSVGDVSRRADGTLIVVNGGTREARLFGQDGSHLRTMGGPGRGPSEFEYPRFIRDGPGDGFSVLDRTLDRVVYDADGEFVERVTFDRAAWNRLLQPLGRGEGLEPLPDGTVLYPVYGENSWGAGTPSPGPPYRPEIAVLRVRPSGAADTLAHIGGILQQFVDVGRDRPIPMVAPFAPVGRWFVARDGGIAIWDGARPEVHRVSADGIHRILRWSAEPEPATRDEIEAFLDEYRASSWARDRLPEWERGWAAMDMPTHKPLVTLAHPALDGTTWVRTGQYGPGPSTWRIFASDGAWLGSTELPGTFEPREIGDGYVLGVDRDPATEVETIALYTVTKPPTR